MLHVIPWTEKKKRGKLTDVASLENDESRVSITWLDGKPSSQDRDWR